MQVTIDLPAEIADQLQRTWGDVSRHILETVAVEAYQAGQLSSAQVRELLGYATPMELDDLLKRARIYRNPSVDELEQDINASRRASTRPSQNQ